MPLARLSLAVLALPGLAAAQQDIVWSTSVASTPGDTVYPEALVIRPDGGSVGLFMRQSGTATLRSFDENGRQTWVVALPGLLFGGGNGFLTDALAVDAASNVYVAAGPPGDPNVTKYSPAGAFVWREALKSTTPSGGFAVASIDVSDAGEVAVAAVAYRGMFNDERTTTVIMLGASGTELWRSAEIPNEFPIVAVDAADGVIVSARRGAYVPSPDALVLRRYDAMGAQSWSLDAAASQSIGFDAQADRIVTTPVGQTYLLWSTSTAIGSRTFVTAVSPAGVERWAWRSDGSPNAVSHPAGLGVDGFGDVVVAVRGVLDPAGSADAFMRTVKLDASGSPRWDATDFGDYFRRAPDQLAVFENGHSALLTTERTHTPGQSPPSGARTVLQMRRRDGNPTGTLVVREIPGQSSLSHGIDIDGRGNLVLGVRESTRDGTNPLSDEALVVKVVLGGERGTTYCAPGAANSTGGPGQLRAYGSRRVSTNNLTLVATELPANAFTLFLIGSMTDMVPNAGGSQGTLCLGGTLGRYARPGEVRSTNGDGSISLQLELTDTPTATGAISIAAGETWNFQAWHRDANPNSTSNFTEAVSVTFQ